MGVIEVLIKQEREKGRLQERKIANAEKLAEKLESARTFKKMGYPAEEIAKALGLRVKQVEDLK